MILSRMNMRLHRYALLTGVVCVALGLALSPRLRNEAGVLIQTLPVALIRSGLWPVAQLPLPRLHPAAQVSHPTDPVAGWSPRRVAMLPDRRPIIGPFGGPEPDVTFAPDIPGTAIAALVTAKLHLFGSWDAGHQPYGGVEGDGIVFAINNVPFHRALFQNWGRSDPYRTARITIGQTRYALTLLRDQAHRDDRGTGARFDSTWSLRLEVTGQTAPWHLSLHSTANDPKDEWFALSQVQVFHD